MGNWRFITEVLLETATLWKPFRRYRKKRDLKQTSSFWNLEHITVGSFWDKYLMQGHLLWHKVKSLQFQFWCRKIQERMGMFTWLQAGGRGCGTYESGRAPPWKPTMLGLGLKPLLQNCGKINFCCFSCSVCGTLSQQPKLTVRLGSQEVGCCFNKYLKMYTWFWILELVIG